MKSIQRTLVAVLFGAAAALPAAAQSAKGQQRDGQQQQQQQQKQKSQKQEQQKRRIATLKGTVQDVRLVNIKGESEKHVLAKVQLANGKVAVVDLGTRNDANKLQLRRGQNLSILGRPGRINGKPIIVGDRARDASAGPDAVIVMTRLIPLDFRIVPQQGQQQAKQQQQQRGGSPAKLTASEARRHAAHYRQLASRALQQGNDTQAERYARQAAQFTTFARQQSQGMQGQQQQASSGAMANRGSGQSTMRLIVGKITDMRDVQLKGIPDKHRLVKLQARQGQTVVVDLGSKGKLKDVKLEKGEAIAAMGAFGRVNGKPVLIATSVADLVTIDRKSGANKQGKAQPASSKQPADQPAQQQDQQQQQQADDAAQQAAAKQPAERQPNAEGANP